MALISCKECGEKISSETRKCPKCGAETPYGKMRGEWIGLLIYLLSTVVFLIWGLIWFFQNAEVFFKFMESDSKEWFLRYYDEASESIGRFIFGVVVFVCGIIDMFIVRKKCTVLQAKERRIKEAQKNQTLPRWQCVCGRMNESYNYSCVCGRSKTEVNVLASKNESSRDKVAEQQNQTHNSQSSQKSQTGDAAKCRFCSACGAPLTGKALYCANCGEKQ